MGFTYKIGRFENLDNCTTIIYQDKTIGEIEPSPFDEGYYCINIAIKKNTEKLMPHESPFQWIFLGIMQYKTQEEAIKYLDDNFDEIIKEYDLYQFDGYHLRNNYRLFRKNKIPECCGSCKRLRIRKNEHRCSLDSQKVSIFAICNDFRLNDNNKKKDKKI